MAGLWLGFKEKHFSFKFPYFVTWYENFLQEKASIEMPVSEVFLAMFLGVRLSLPQQHRL